MTKKLKIPQNPVCWQAILIFILSLFVLQCSNNDKQKNESPKQQISNLKPLTVHTLGQDTIKPPTVVLIDTCPKPQIFVIPKTGTTSAVIQTPTGPKLIRLVPPLVTPLPMSLNISTGEMVANPEAQGLGFFTNYTTDDGLAVDGIKCGYCDKTGNLWFGTFGGGLSRFDGKSFTNFTLTQGLAGAIIYSIKVDRVGNIWIGTWTGVSCYDGKSFSNFTTVQGLANNIVKSIVEDNKGNLWFGTEGGGVSRYDRRSFTNFTKAQGLADDIIYNIIEDKDGKLWFGTRRGISCYNGKTFANFTKAQGLVDNRVRCITEDKNGNLWFGTESGVSRYDGKTFTNFTQKQGLPNNIILCISEDKLGNLWFGTEGGGVSRFDGNSFTNFNTNQGIASNIVCSITLDRKGNLWFGTESGGLSCYNGNAFINFTKDQGLQYSSIRSILEDKLGNLWFGTSGGGVNRYDGNSLIKFSTDQGLANNTVGCIVEDIKGNIWFGSWGGGVSCFDGKSFTNFTTYQGLANDTVRFIKIDKTGNLWFGTYGGGISRYDGKSFTNYNTKQGLASNFIRCIAEDESGNFWFGTLGGGASCYNGKSFINFTTSQGLVNNVIHNITKDKSGNLWFSTQGGISIFNNSEIANIKKSLMPKKKTDNNIKLFNNITTENGLPDNNVVQVMQSDDGKIYVGTQKGICEIIADIEGNYKIVSIFNLSTGYPVKDVNSGQSGMYEDSRGIIWVGTGSNKTGLVRFDPKAVIKSIEPPTVILQGINVNNENISWYNLMKPVVKGGAKQPSQQDSNQIISDSLAILNEEVLTFKHPLSFAERDTMRVKFSEIRFDSITKFYPIPQNLKLPYKQNNITFEFNAIEPARHYMVRYQYVLEGYDKEWSPVTDKSSASFGNIYEGTYTFKLKAMCPDGVWSEPISYTFKVLPPWYRTIWMYVVYIMIFISALYIIYIWRVAKLKREKQLLEGKVKLRTAQLQQANEEITAQNDLVTHQKEELQSTLEHLKLTQAELIQSEKMASLGQLIAGIAHEINTPLGAINASITTITDSTQQSIKLLPELVKTLSDKELKLFMDLVNRSAINNNSFSSKEEREVRRKITTQLEEKGIAGADDFADILVDMGIYDELENYLTLYKPQTMQAAYHLSMQIKNSKNIKMAVDRAAKVVFALKNYARYGNDHSMVEANIVDGLETVLILYQNQLKHGISLHKEFEEVPPILCYPDELNQVWTNLLHNAIHAMEGKGELTISVSKNPKGFTSTTSTTSTGSVTESVTDLSGLEIQITDTGKGIPPEIKDRIFDAFFTTKPAGEGAGLGLYIVKQIIDKHKGRIWFESVVGSGTNVFVELPVL